MILLNLKTRGRNMTRLRNLKTNYNSLSFDKRYLRRGSIIEYTDRYGNKFVAISEDILYSGKISPTKVVENPKLEKKNL